MEVLYLQVTSNCAKKTGRAASDAVASTPSELTAIVTVQFGSDRNETSQWRWHCRQLLLFDLDHCTMNEPSWLFPLGVQTNFSAEEQTSRRDQSVSNLGSAAATAETIG